MEIRPGKGVLKKERSFQTPGNTLTGESVASLGTSEGNTTGRKNKQLKPTDYKPNVTPPEEKQRRCLHPPLASGGWAGRRRLHCLE